jgi:hypothetical protein
MTQAARSAFPGARLIRDMGVKEPRPRHQENLGEVRLKTDPRWAEFHNAKDIGGFGVPWGPYGFNSGVTQEDVSREDAMTYGLPVLDAPEPVDTAGFNDGLQASVKRLDPALKAKLLEELRSVPKPQDPREAAREAAASVRREMLNRGLTEAITRGQTSKAEKYRTAIASLPQITGLIVREDGEKILLESVPQNAIVTQLPDDYDPQKQEPHVPLGKREMGADQEPIERAIALDVRAASQAVYPGWTIPDGDESTGDGGQRAIEAQLAAAVTGRKPLYFDPWGEQFSDAFAQAYRKVIPIDVEVVSRDGMLFVFRPEAVTLILDSDPGFYRHAGESVIDSIVRVSGQGMNLKRKMESWSNSGK